MAIFYLNVKTVSRSHNRSAVAAAAYRSASLIYDERAEVIHDYRRKSGVEYRELLLPADSPDWAQDRSQLWNEIEKAEKRSNSTVAREIELALPHQLSVDGRQQLAADFARELMERHRCAIDVSIHAPHRKHDERNYHAHILMSTRRLEASGFTEKTREWDDRQTGPELVMSVRERWAELVNERLELEQINERVDHRSLSEQGIDREPQHLSMKAFQFERRTGLKSEHRKWREEREQERANQRLQEIQREREQSRALDQQIIDLETSLAEAVRERDSLIQLEQEQSREGLLEEMRTGGRGILDQWRAEARVAEEVKREIEERARKLEREQERLIIVERGRAEEGPELGR